jgi:hypothetical protein
MANKNDQAPFSFRSPYDASGSGRRAIDKPSHRTHDQRSARTERSAYQVEAPSREVIKRIKSR